MLIFRVDWGVPRATGGYWVVLCRPTLNEGLVIQQSEAIDVSVEIVVSLNVIASLLLGHGKAPTSPSGGFRNKSLRESGIRPYK